MMNTNIVIQPYQTGDETEIYRLIRRVYDEFVAVDYTDEGNKFFYNWIDPVRIAERQRNNRSILVARQDSELAGMIEIRDNNTISLLFVDKDFQQKGIAKRLFRQALSQCRQKDPDLAVFFVHASPYSVNVYRRLGFVETGGMLEENGIKYYPMKLDMPLPEK